MAFIPAPGVAEFVMRYGSSAGGEMVNVYNILHQTSSWTPTELTAMCQLLEAWEGGAPSDHRSLNVWLERISARDIGTQFGNILEYDVTPAINGTLQFPMLPKNVTFCLTYRTGMAGRSRRGRHYWIGLAESQVTNDLVLINEANAMKDALTNLNSVLLFAEGALLVVVSRQENLVPRTVAQVAGINSIFYTDLRVDTQRRRLNGN